MVQNREMRKIARAGRNHQDNVVCAHNAQWLIYSNSTDTNGNDIAAYAYGFIENFTAVDCCLFNTSTRVLYNYRVLISENSSDLGHFIFTPSAQVVLAERSVYTLTGGP
jgi:hypothetical protein